MTRAAGYCRLSDVGGSSVERQEKLVRKIAAGKGWELVAVFKEWLPASEFARKPRVEWEKLLQGIENGEWDALIIWMEDRSNRDILQAAEFVQVAREAGCKLVLPSYEYDFDDPEHVARFYGEVSRAQGEVARLSKRVRAARQEEAEEGLRHPGGKRAFGESGAGPKGNGGKAPAGQVEHERAAIVEAAERLVAGDSLRGIVHDWNAGPGQPPRVRPAVGAEWSTRSLKRMLLSPRLAGMREHHGTLYPSDTITPILERELWEQVRGILTDPSRHQQLAGRPALHLLSGMAFCGVCKAKLRVDRDRDGELVYRCPPPTDGGKGCVTRRAKPVEELILDALFRAAATPKLKKLQQPAEPADPTAALYEMLARDQGRLDKLDDEQVMARLDEDHVKAAAVRRVRAEVEQRMDRTRARARRMQGGRVAAHVPPNLGEVWDDYSRDRQRAILKAVLRLPPDGKGIEVHPQGRGRDFDPDAITADWRA